MRVKKSAIFGFVLGCLILSVPVQGVVIEPTIVAMPSAAGETFSFDYTINNPMGTSGRAFQSTTGVSGPGTLTFDSAGSEAVASAGNYWLVGNSGGAGALDLGGNSYQFGDDPFDGAAQGLAVGNVMARYSFTWDGTPGNYTFTLDTSTSNSFVLNEFFGNDALALPNPASQWWTDPIISADETSFTVAIPEPSTVVLLALGGAGLLKRRRR
jgi:hypothetical protein